MLHYVTQQYCITNLLNWEGEERFKFRAYILAKPLSFFIVD